MGCIGSSPSQSGPSGDKMTSTSNDHEKPDTVETTKIPTESKQDDAIETFTDEEVEPPMTGAVHAPMTGAEPDRDWKGETRRQITQLQTALEKNNQSSSLQLDKINTVNEQLDTLNKQLSDSATAKRIGNFASTLSNHIGQLSSDNGYEMASGVIGTVSAFAMLGPPPYGEVVASVIGLFSTIFGMVGGSSDSTEMQISKVVSDAVNNAVLILSDKIDQTELDNLNAAATGLKDTFDTVRAYLNGLTMDSNDTNANTNEKDKDSKHDKHKNKGILGTGLKIDLKNDNKKHHKHDKHDKHDSDISSDLSPTALNSISTNVPASIGSDFMGQLRSHMTTFRDNNQGNENLISASINLLPIYANLAAMRDNLFNLVISILQKQNETDMANGYANALRSSQERDKELYSSINYPSSPLWIATDDDATIQGFTQYRTHEKMIFDTIKLADDPTDPPPTVSNTAFDLNTDPSLKPSNDVAGGSLDVAKVTGGPTIASHGDSWWLFDAHEIKSQDTPLVGLYFYDAGRSDANQSDVIALGAQTVTKVDITDNNILYGTADVGHITVDDSQILQGVKGFDTNVVMVSDATSEAVFGVKLVEYDGDGDESTEAESVAIQIYCGNIDGTGDKQWIGANTMPPNGKPIWFEDSEVGYYDQNVVSYPASSGYIVGVQMFQRDNRISLRLYKTVP